MALSETLLDKENPFYQPVCVMIRGVNRDDYLKGNKTELAS